MTAQGRERPSRVLRLSAARHAREKPPTATNGIHFSEELVEAMVLGFTSPGDGVVDPFAGYGTTVRVADRLGRPALGLELQRHRVEYARGRLPAGSPSRIMCADARCLAGMDLGEFALCLTSPPYMTAWDHPEDPLDAYRTRGSGYEDYLDGVTEILGHAGARVRDGGHVVVNAATLRADDRITTLAWDLGRRLSGLFDFRGEIYLDWDGADGPADPSFVVADYCLVFRVNQR